MTVFHALFQQYVWCKKAIKRSVLMNVSIKIIPHNDTFLYGRTNEIFLSFVFIMGYPGITQDNFHEIFFCLHFLLN